MAARFKLRQTTSATALGHSDATGLSGRRSMTGDRVKPPICSSCGYWYVAAANDPICIECGRIQRTLVAWCLMRAAEIGPLTDEP
jgi:hypothetical protein